MGDGRNSGNKAISGTGTDWIGLFRKDTCNSPKNLVDRHKCYLATRSVPRTQMWGEVIFEVNDYKEAGDYDVRYFYGDDPSMRAPAQAHISPGPATDMSATPPPVWRAAYSTSTRSIRTGWPMSTHVSAGIPPMTVIRTSQQLIVRVTQLPGTLRPGGPVACGTRTASPRWTRLYKFADTTTIPTWKIRMW